MPKRFCQCRGCPACNTPGRKPGSHSTLFDADSTGTLKCPPCQGIATQQRNQRPSTAGRGYDGGHRRIREQLLARWQPGDPCALCGWPMTERWMIVNGKRVSALDLAHNEDRSGWRGLSHRQCNRATNKG